MSAQSPRDQHLVATARNTARYFCEAPEVAWALLVGTMLWGAYAYERMPKAKDPLVPPRVAVVSCTWPGASAEKIEPACHPAHALESMMVATLTGDRNSLQV